MKLVAIARLGLVRLLRDRGNLFSIFVLPLLLVLLLGTQFGDREALSVGLHGPDELVERVAERLRADGGIEPVVVADEATLREDALSGRFALGVSIPDSGPPVRVTTFAREDGAGPALAPIVAGALSEELLVPWLQANGAGAGAARAAADDTPRTAVELRDASGVEVAASSDRFGPGAASQLVLIVFLTSLLSATTMVQNRKLGVTRRMLATPSRISTIVAGEAAARWAVALMQGVYIIVASALLFGVEWGNVGLTALLLLAFTGVGAGAGMLLGALFDEEMVVVGLSIMLGLTIGALGGAMVPRELFGPALGDVAGLIPHAWAIDGFEAIREGEGLSAVLGPFALLAGAAALLLGLASWRLLGRLTRV